VPASSSDADARNCRREVTGPLWQA
jgi:hypothetical protein